MKGILFALLNEFLLVPLKSTRKCNRSTLVLCFTLNQQLTKLLSNTKHLWGIYHSR